MAWIILIHSASRTLSTEESNYIAFEAQALIFIFALKPFQLNRPLAVSTCIQTTKHANMSSTGKTLMG